MNSQEFVKVTGNLTTSWSPEPRGQAH